MKTFVLLWIALSTSILVHAQTLHAIIVANTDIEDIGKSCEIDQIAMTVELNAIASSIDYDFNIINITRGNFTFENVESTIKDFECKPNDIIIFYYSGHGFNTDDNDSKWPVMHLKTGGYPLDVAHKKMKAKGARLVITMGDCCNEIVKFTSAKKKGFVIVKPEDEKTQKKNFYKRLFVETKGDILISGCERGQCAYSSEMEGGFYTNNFIKSLNYALNYSRNISWEELLNDVKNKVSAIKFTDIQVPQHHINYTSEPDEPVLPVKPVVSYDVVNGYFAGLINPNTPRETKNKMLVKNIDYFTENARVDIFVQTTLTEVMTIEAFTNRLMLHANKISDINFIENQSKTNENGKYEHIRIQEVWTKQ